MEPNTNQPLESNPVAQPVAQPVSTEAKVAASTPVLASVPEGPKGKNNNVIILLVILLLLVIGIIAYILFAKGQLSNTQKITTDNNSSVLPSPTTVPTLAPQDDLEVLSPEGDIIDIETDVKGL